MENKEHINKAGDIVNIYGGLNLWCDGLIAGMNGCLRYPNTDERNVMKPATEEETNDYFKQLDYNGLKWNPSEKCFESKDPNCVKYHKGEWLVEKHSITKLYVVGVMLYKSKLYYQVREGGGYDCKPVDEVEENYFSETEINTIPKRKYRIVKVSNENDPTSTVYSIQERKFGFLWLYLDADISESPTRCSILKIFAKSYISLYLATYDVLKLRIYECCKRIGKKKKPKIKTIIPVEEIKLTSF